MSSRIARGIGASGRSTFCSVRLRILFRGCAEHTDVPHPLALLCAQDAYRRARRNGQALSTSLEREDPVRRNDPVQYALKEIRACIEAEMLTDVQHRLALLSRDMDNHNGQRIPYQPALSRS